MDQFVGKTLGQYQIVSMLGRGGMAVVYKAYQPALQRYVAVKVLLPQLGADPDFIRRFQHEAVAAAKLRHPNIVTVHDVGLTDGVNYIVMEYVEGESLADVIRRSGAMPPERVGRIIAQVASALDYAHAQGFVHRDIKPSNIMLGAGDHVTLTDFGIAKAMSGTRLTQTGSIIGTPEYMSPEQVRGLPVDHRADIYSLGIVAYEMLSGQVPFSGDTASVLYKQAHEMPPPIRARAIQVPAHVAGAIDHALVKDPDQRFATAGAFAQALTGQPVARPVAPPPPPMAVFTPPAPSAPSSPSRAKRSTWPLWAIGGAVALLLVCVVVIGVALIASSLGKATPSPTVTIAISQRNVTVTSGITMLPKETTATVTTPASSTFTPSPRPAKPSDTPVPTRTFTPPPTKTPTRTLTPTPSCPPVTGPFSDIWQSVKDRLGCATDGASVTWMAEESFQSGRMFWRKDNDQHYALFNGDGWGVYPNTWKEGDPEITCSSGTPITPVRGFGKIWCTVPGVRSGLGNATAGELGFNGTVQDFQRGLIIRTDSGATYVMYSGGGWETR